MATVTEAIRHKRIALAELEAETVAELVGLYASAHEAIIADFLRLAAELGDNPTPGQLFRLERYRQLLEQTERQTAAFAGSAAEVLEAARARAVAMGAADY